MTFPENGARKVSLDTIIKAKFSEQISAGSINVNTFILKDENNNDLQ